MPDMGDGMPDMDDEWHPQAGPDSSGTAWGWLMN